ncbi:MAG: hypothetical protein LQ342_001245 [Letrouitia transgressa]|nr:MAG: hypothetical protein LQ342_001245 [Letrouitia transgressa]
MSFLLRTSTRTLPIARARLLSTTPLVRKSAVDTAKDAAKNVDRKVSDAAVKGIEKGGKSKANLANIEQASAKAKESVGLGAKKAEGTASEVAGEAKGKASEVTGEAKGKAQEVTGKARGKAEEVKGKL